MIKDGRPAPSRELKKGCPRNSLPAWFHWSSLGSEFNSESVRGCDSKPTMAETQISSGTILPFPRAHYLALPPGDAGIRLTIARMMDLAQSKEGAMNPQVRAWALAATASAPDRDDYAQAAAIFDAVHRGIRFRGEYDETIQSPLTTLQLQAGDCDDHAILLAALLRSIGIPARFETVATDASKEFSHVFTVAGVRQNGRVVRWLPLDTTVPQSYPGWKAPIVTRDKSWDRMGWLGVEAAPGIPLSQKALDISAVIQSAGNTATNIITAARNTGSGSNFNVVRDAQGGVSGTVGASPSMLIVGGLGALAVIAMLFRGRK
jgi:transglutaminase-like putative cysteine protease